jgi:phosphoglycerate kinase
MEKLPLKNLNVENKKVFVRVDFNVPLDENGKITNDARIKATLPTINYLITQNAKIILASHLGRPKGKVDKKYSLSPVANRLSELLKKKVEFASDCINEEAENKAKSLKSGEVLLLENLRFYKEEEENNLDFAKKLASLAEVYVNDAFGTAHRAHASTEGVTKFLSPCAAGFLMEKEINFLGELLENPKRPFIAILGGAKVSDKIKVIENLLIKVNIIIVAGGMAYTFFKARGVPIGHSIVEEDKIGLAKEILKKAIDLGVPFLLPIDHVVTDKISAEGKTKIVHRMGIPADLQAVDIGPGSIEKFGYALENVKTIFWNGPVGVFEVDQFAKGTIGVAKLVAKATENGAVSVVGGGDSISALEKSGLTDKITHISTGGGASLEFMEGKVLPGIAALTNKEK